jgi:hypothetical protein
LDNLYARHLEKVAVITFGIDQTKEPLNEILGITYFFDLCYCLNILWGFTFRVIQKHLAYFEIEEQGIKPSKRWETFKAKDENVQG